MSEKHNHQVMAEQLRTSSLWCQKSEKNGRKDRNDLGTDALENGMHFTRRESSSKPKIITVRQIEKKSAAVPEKGMGREGQDGEELGQRTWNLRSRTNASGRRSGISNPESNIPENEKKNEKPKFSFSLTREEIEEDFIKMTGSKPPRKSKKRPKNVQKAMDVNKSCHIVC